MSRELANAPLPTNAAMARAVTMSGKCISKLAFELRALKANDKAKAAYWKCWQMEMENDLKMQMEYVDELEDAVASSQVTIEAMEKELAALRAEKALKKHKKMLRRSWAFAHPVKKEKTKRHKNKETTIQYFDGDDPQEWDTLKEMPVDDEELRLLASLMETANP
jgi:uncharacterized coiled-coil protein SlyX